MAQVFFSSDTDPEMQRAKETARATFRYLWRELSWEYRRIIPGLDVAAVKVPFRDPEGTPGAPGGSDVEEMWVGDVVFDGVHIAGRLLNTPNWLRSIAAGDRVEVPLAGISDWMYAMRGRMYGAYTVHHIRKSMSPDERAAHDAAWGFEFGDPDAPLVIPEDHAPPPADHPMSVNMGPTMREQVKKHHGQFMAADEQGFTTLHSLALAGSTTGVAVLLEAGADPTLRTKHGMTARDLAAVLSWEPVMALLDGATRH